MFELIRMDLRRMVKGKTLWVLPLVIVSLLAFTYGLMAVMTSPENLAAMAAQGAEITAEDYAEGSAIAQYSALQFLREALFNGGFWLCIIGFGAGLFAVSDFTSGYAKNIFPLFERRWPYAAARAVSLFVLTAVTLGAAFLFTLLLQPFSVFASWGGSALDWLQMYVVGCATGWAFSMLMQFCAALLRHEGPMVAAIVVLGGGLIPLLLGVLFKNAPIDPSSYTIFACTQMASSMFAVPVFNSILGLCLAWGVVYIALTTLVLEKRDVV